MLFKWKLPAIIILNICVKMIDYYLGKKYWILILLLSYSFQWHVDYEVFGGGFWCCISLKDFQNNFSYWNNIYTFLSDFLSHLLCQNIKFESFPANESWILLCRQIFRDNLSNFYSNCYEFRQNTSFFLSQSRQLHRICYIVCTYFWFYRLYIFLYLKELRWLVMIFWQKGVLKIK